LLLVWHAVIWTIWTSRNDLIFSGSALREESMVDRAKLLAWKWFLAKCPASSCSFHEWEVQPVLCWQRWRVGGFFPGFTGGLCLILSDLVPWAFLAILFPCRCFVSTFWCGSLRVLFLVFLGVLSRSSPSSFVGLRCFPGVLFVFGGVFRHPS